MRVGVVNCLRARCRAGNIGLDRNNVPICSNPSLISPKVERVCSGESKSKSGPELAPFISGATADSNILDPSAPPSVVAEAGPSSCNKISSSLVHATL